jgi:hypothetical protein
MITVYEVVRLVSYDTDKGPLELYISLGLYKNEDSAYNEASRYEESKNVKITVVHRELRET